MGKGCISKKDCRKFAKTLGFCPSQARCSKNGCFVAGNRCLGTVKYQPTHQKVKSPIVGEISFSTERNKKGCVINLGQVPVLSSELNDFLKHLVHHSIKISSVNTPLIKVKPQIVTVNIFSTEDQPQEFACALKKVMEEVCSKKLGKSIYQTILKPKHKDSCKKHKCSSSSSTCTSSSSSSKCSSSSSSSKCSSSSSSDCSSSSTSECSSSSSSSDCSSSSSSSDCSSSSSSSDCSSSSSSTSTCSSSSSSDCTNQWYY